MASDDATVDEAPGTGGTPAHEKVLTATPQGSSPMENMRRRLREELTDSLEAGTLSDLLGRIGVDAATHHCQQHRGNTMITEPALPDKVEDLMHETAELRARTEQIAGLVARLADPEDTK